MDVETLQKFLGMLAIDFQVRQWKGLPRVPFALMRGLHLTPEHVVSASEVAAPSKQPLAGTTCFCEVRRERARP